MCALAPDPCQANGVQLKPGDIKTMGGEIIGVASLGASSSMATRLLTGTTYISIARGAASAFFEPN